MAGGPLFRAVAAVVLTVVLLSTTWVPRVYSGAFRFSDLMGVDVVTHPRGYNGAGGTVRVSIGIDPTSTHAGEMVQSIQNVVDTINALVPTVGNLHGGTRALKGRYDFESVALHEVLHSLGLDHPNVGNKSGRGSERNYTAATKGRNRGLDLNSGRDGVIGSKRRRAGRRREPELVSPVEQQPVHDGLGSGLDDLQPRRRRPAGRTHILLKRRSSCRGSFWRDGYRGGHAAGRGSR